MLLTVLYQSITIDDAIEKCLCFHLLTFLTVYFTALALLICITPASPLAHNVTTFVTNLYVPLCYHFLLTPLERHLYYQFDPFTSCFAVSLSNTVLLLLLLS